MATTTAKTKDADAAATDPNPAEEIVPVEIDKDPDITPAERDKLDPPITDGEAQAQAFAVDQSANLQSRPPFPIAAPADVHSDGFDDIVSDVISSSLVFDELEVLNRKNTEIRLAIAGRFPNLDVKDIFIRARREDKGDGKYGPLVVESKLGHGDWKTVKVNRGS